MFKPEKDIYNIYIKKCTEESSDPISYEHFKLLWNKTRETLFQMKKVNNRKEPYIAVMIDKKLVMYQEIKIGKLVTNIWNKDQFNFLVGGIGEKRNNI